MTPYDQFKRTGDAEMDRLLDDFGKLSARFEKMHEELSELRGHGEAANGQVRVEVAPGGALLGVEIDPRAMRLASEELCEAIMDAFTEASDMAANRLNGVLSPLIDRVDGFNEAMQGRMPRMEPGVGIGADPQVAEALRSLKELRAKYDL
ncbi:YbaB/EbfC family nucleoid-associated protein [Nonomuraea dietziae]|uniref:YbaB/EbfC family nucleoid-associated protein n=1 Tax=Nonomuraea dietziae TaxID=65515 RepID=UPI0034231AFD